MYLHEIQLQFSFLSGLPAFRLSKESLLWAVSKGSGWLWRRTCRPCMLPRLQPRSVLMLLGSGASQLWQNTRFVWPVRLPKQAHQRFLHCSSEYLDIWTTVLGVCTESCGEGMREQCSPQTFGAFDGSVQHILTRHHMTCLPCAEAYHTES